jgi:hypothetical protein
VRKSGEIPDLTIGDKMVFEIINELIDSAFMNFGKEFIGLCILAIKLLGFGYGIYWILKLIFQKRK